MRPLKKIFFAAALIALCPTVRAEEAVLADSIQAVVNDVPITQQEVVRFIGPEQEYIYRQYSSQPDVYRKKIMTLSENGSETLIVREVILHDFKETIKIPESIIEEIVQDELKQKYPDHIALTKELQQEGTTLEQLKQKIRDQFIVEQMRLKNVPEPVISPLKIEDFYTEHRNDFKVEDQIKMRMIVLNRTSSENDDATRRRAGEILSQVQGGASFDELARSYSEGSLRQDGGETGWEDLSVVSKTLLNDLNKLKPGEHSGVIEAPDGFYILLLEDRTPAHFRPLSEVRNQIEHELSARETDRLQKKWIERLKTKTFVKYF